MSLSDFKALCAFSNAAFFEPFDDGYVDQNSPNQEGYLPFDERRTICSSSSSSWFWFALPNESDGFLAGFASLAFFFRGLPPFEPFSDCRFRYASVSAITSLALALTKRSGSAMLVECAWAYRFPARRTRVIQCRAEQASPAVQAIAWKAQKRLCGRFRRLSGRGVIAQKTVTAIARELCGFIWAVVCEVQQPGKLPAPA